MTRHDSDRYRFWFHLGLKLKAEPQNKTKKLPNSFRSYIEAEIDSHSRSFVHLFRPPPLRTAIAIARR
jgi:hypothetical protein